MLMLFNRSSYGCMPVLCSQILTAPRWHVAPFSRQRQVSTPAGYCSKPSNWRACCRIGHAGRLCLAAKVAHSRAQQLRVVYRNAGSSSRF